MPIGSDLPIPDSAGAASAAHQAGQSEAMNLITADTFDEYRAKISETAAKSSIKPWQAILALVTLAVALGVFGKGLTDDHLGKILGGAAGTLVLFTTLIGIIKHNVGVSNTAEEARKKLDALTDNDDFIEYQRQAEILAEKRVELSGVEEDIQTTASPTKQLKSIREKEALEKEIQIRERDINKHFAAYLSGLNAVLKGLPK